MRKLLPLLLLVVVLLLDHLVQLNDNSFIQFGIEQVAVAEALLECDGDWERTKEKTFRENLMNKDKLSSNQRYFLLMKQRLEALNDAEIRMLVNSTVAVQRMIVLLAICKAHAFIFDFITEMVRECFYNLHERLTNADFNEFFNEKKYEHPELERVTEQTVHKMIFIICHSQQVQQ